MVPQLHRIRRPLIAAVVLALAVVGAFLSGGVDALSRAIAVPATTVPEQAVTVDVVQPSPSITTTGTLQATVFVGLAAPAEYVEVRLRLYRPSGALLYQKTELRPNSPAGEVAVSFSRELGELGIREGRYPLDVRVLATGSDPTEAESRLLVVERGRRPVQVAAVARLTAVPAIDGDGRFVIDPAAEPGARLDASRLAQVAARRTRRDFSLALPPLLLEEWARTADGYETTGAAGVRALPAASEAPLAAADTLERLRALASDGAVEFLDVPYADPALADMRAHDGLLEDLAAQWATGDAIRATTLGTDASRALAVFGDALPAAALPQLQERGITAVALRPTSLDAGESTATPGVYDLGSGVRAVVLDERLAEAVATEDRETFYDIVFERLNAEAASGPLAFTLDLGPGTERTARLLEQALDWIDAADWCRAATLTEAAAARPAGRATLVEEPLAPGAPSGYWADVAEGRAHALAAVAAYGAEDPDAIAARQAVLIAEAAAWTGPYAAVSSASRGREFATEVTRRVGVALAGVTVSGSDVTLANRRGDVPVSIVNGSGRRLTVRVTATSDRASVDAGETTVTLDPGENIIAIPVDMNYEIAGRLDVRVMAADVSLGSAAFTVRASYLDRLAWVGVVVVFLIAMLIFIRRRVRTAIAGTIVEENGARGGESSPSGSHHQKDRP